MYEIENKFLYWIYPNLSPTFAPSKILVGKKHVLFVLFGLIGFSAIGQQSFILLKGKVTDVRNGEPLPFVSIVVEGRFVGTSSDTLGNYSLKVPKTALRVSDTLTATSLGYRTLKKKINTELQTQVIDLPFR